LSVNVVAEALMPAASTVCALLAAKSVSAIYPPGFGQQKKTAQGGFLVVKSLKI
jgi:hypothetical protein